MRDYKNYIVGLDTSLEVYTGYDRAERNMYPFRSPASDEDVEETGTASKEEKVSLAELMIARWQTYKDEVLK